MLVRSHKCAYLALLKSIFLITFQMVKIHIVGHTVLYNNTDKDMYTVMQVNTARHFLFKYGMLEKRSCEKNYSALYQTTKNTFLGFSYSNQKWTKGISPKTPNMCCSGSNLSRNLIENWRSKNSRDCPFRFYVLYNVPYIHMYYLHVCKHEANL